MGLYQVEPTGGKFIIGSPLYKSVTIQLPDNATFRITAENNSSENIYIRSATLNGKPYTKSFLEYADIMRGGELALVMGSEPSDFGIQITDRP